MVVCFDLPEDSEKGNMVNKLTLPSLDPETRYVARVRAKSRLGVFSDWSAVPGAEEA